MSIKSKLTTGLIIFLILSVISVFVYFKYFFTYEQRNVFQRKVETITGQNLTITLFTVDGEIIKRWTGIRKITSGPEHRNYVYFYTKEGKYVQIPNSTWYIAEEE